MDLVGYCIGNDREEFLSYIDSSRAHLGSMVLGWLPHPNYAKIYRSQRAASRVIHKLERSDLQPVPLYDAGDQWIAEWGACACAA